MKRTVVLSAIALFLGTSAMSEESRRPINGDKALEILKASNDRMLRNKPEKSDDGLGKALENKASIKKQHPFATIIACSDSRIPMGMIFDQGIGDMFVVRNAGNVVDETVLGTVEYGVEHLNTPLLVIMGHTNCGAVTAAVSEEKFHGHIQSIIAKIRPLKKKALSKNHELKNEALLNAVISENVTQSADTIISKSAIVREKIASGQLKVVGALYDLETGKVSFFDIYEKAIKEAAPKQEQSPISEWQLKKM